MKSFALLPFLVSRSRYSRFWLFVLNAILARTIPFNKPHRFRITAIAEDAITAYTPYRRSNHNHIRGIHACAIATVAEFCAGFLLLTRLDPSRYRLIMGRLEADYSYQAKQPIIAEARISEDELQRCVHQPLEKELPATVVMTTLLRDLSGNHIAEVKTTWQVKDWQSVRTKV